MDKGKFKNLFRNRNFKLLFWGEVISNIGDQFTFVGLAWLVARMTGSSVAVGTVLALSGFPRAILMFLSGTVIDRFSPRAVMLASNFTRFLVVIILAVLILTGKIEIWMIYLIALLFGIFDAFFIPARASLVPRIVSQEVLGIGNTLIQGLTQLSQFIGPFLVGSLIGFIEYKTNNFNGIGIAMIVDSLTFIISIMTLRLIKDASFARNKKEQFAGMLKKGLASVWQHRGLRYILVAATMVNFCIIGPFLVGIPLIAKNQLAGAYSFGFIVSAWGIGALVGYALAGFLTPKRNPSVYLLIIASLIGVFFSLFKYAQTTPQFMLVSFICAVAAGYVMISFITIVQKNTPPEMMGRTMGILIFSSIGLNPVSELIAGHIMERYLGHVFLWAGLLIIISSLTPLFIRSVREYGNSQTQH